MKEKIYCWWTSGLVYETVKHMITLHMVWHNGKSSRIPIPVKQRHTQTLINIKWTEVYNVHYSTFSYNLLQIQLAYHCNCPIWDQTWHNKLQLGSLIYVCSTARQSPLSVYTKREQGNKWNTQNKCGLEAWLIYNLVYLQSVATCITILVYIQIVLRIRREMAWKIHVNKNGE